MLPANPHGFSTFGHLLLLWAWKRPAAEVEKRNGVDRPTFGAGGGKTCGVVVGAGPKVPLAGAVAGSDVLGDADAVAGATTESWSVSGTVAAALGTGAG